MSNAFAAGGFGMYPTLVFGLLLVGTSLRYAATPHARWVPLMVSLGLVTLFAGALGFTTGLIATSQAAGRSDAASLAIAGFGESLHNLALAFLLIVMASMAAALGALRVARAPVTDR